jgi:hypothetical protein
MLYEHELKECQGCHHDNVCEDCSPSKRCCQFECCGAFHKKSLQNCPNCNKMNPEYLCYECARWQNVENMQDYACVICAGRKCKKLHGGEFNYKCVECETDHLCADCFGFARCCKNFCCDEFYDKSIGECPKCATKNVQLDV